MNYFKVPTKSVSDPAKMTIAELKRYKGVEFEKLARVMRNCMKGKYMLLAPLGIYLASIPFIEVSSVIHIFGVNNKGGEMLNLKTKLSDDDIKYNREFQKMRFLSEPNYTKLGEDTEKVLAIKRAGGEVGLEAPQQDYVKVMPHYKHI